jgi:toxin FitB
VFILDTNVISELRKKKPHGAVLAWLLSIADTELFISAVTLGEIQAGIELTRLQDPSKASEIEAWLEQVIATFGVLPMDGKDFRLWAKLMHNRSSTISEDLMIAATAKARRFTIATRNTSDFEGLGVSLVNPFKPMEG